MQIGTVFIRETESEMASLRSTRSARLQSEVESHTHAWGGAVGVGGHPQSFDRVKDVVLGEAASLN